MQAHVSTYGCAARVCLYFNHQQWHFPTFTCCTLLLRAQTCGICIINYVNCYFCMRYILLALLWNNIFSPVFSHLSFFFDKSIKFCLLNHKESKIMEKRCVHFHWLCTDHMSQQDENTEKRKVILSLCLLNNSGWLLSDCLWHIHTPEMLQEKRPHTDRNSLTWMHI